MAPKKRLMERVAEVIYEFDQESDSSEKIIGPLRLATEACDALIEAFAAVERRGLVRFDEGTAAWEEWLALRKAIKALEGE